MNTFYMVFVEGCATPACKHDSLDSAEKEASLFPSSVQVAALASVLVKVC